MLDLILAASDVLVEGNGSVKERLAQIHPMLQEAMKEQAEWPAHLWQQAVMVADQTAIAAGLSDEEAIKAEEAFVALAVAIRGMAAPPTKPVQMTAEEVREHIAWQEAGHAVVGIALGFKATMLFIDREPPRRGGVDFDLPEQKDFDLDKPIEERRRLAVRLATMYSAGFLAEERGCKTHVKRWVEGDDGDLKLRQYAAVYGVAGSDDAAVLTEPEKLKEWAKWPQAEELIRLSEERAKELLHALWGCVQQVEGLAVKRGEIPGDMLHSIVSGWLEKIDVSHLLDI